MLKRLLLVLITLGCSLTALVLYHWLTPAIDSEHPSLGKNPSTTLPITDPAIDENQQQFLEVQDIKIGQIQGLHFQDRDPSGKLTREFGFKERIRSEEDVVLISEPWTKIYLKNSRIIEIRAERGGIPLESSMGSFKYPESGFLEEKVRLIVYRQEAADTALELRPLELTVELDRIVFERDMSRLVCSGPIHARSEKIELQGKNLSLIYDQLQERLQELELRNLQQLTIAREALESREKSPREKPSTSSVDTKENASAKKKIPYRFTLFNQVQIDLGKEQILADLLEIVTDMDAGPMAEDAPKTADKTHPAGEQPAGTGETALSADESQPPVTITCSGSLRIAVAEDITPSEAGDQLQVRMEGKPARILRNSKPVVESDIMIYDQTLEQFTLNSRENRPILLNLSEESRATAQQEIQLDMQNGIAALIGPGQVEHQTPDMDQPMVIDYQDRMKMKFTPQTGPKDYSQDSLMNIQIEELAFDGTLHIRDENGELSAGQGLLTFFESGRPIDTASTDPNDYPMPPIRSIDLASHIRAQSENLNLSAEKLAMNFEPAKDGKPFLKNVQLAGNVYYEDPNYLIEAGDKITLEFAAEADGPAASKTSDKPQSQSSLGIDQLWKDNPPVYALAEGTNGKFRLTAKQENYRIIGDRAEIDLLQEICTVAGQPAQVLQMNGQNTLGGNLIVADLKKEFCQMPDSGVLNALLPGDLMGSSSSEPVPFHIVWQEGAIFDLKNGNISLRNVQADSQFSQDNQRMENRITCSGMTIQFLVEQSSLPNPDAAAEKEPSLSFVNKDTLKNLDTFTAEGPSVSFISKGFDPLNNQLLFSLQMEARQMTFDKAANTLLAQGKGWIEIIDNRKSKDTPKTEENPQDPLANMFSSRGPSYTLVNFMDQMHLQPNQKNLQFTGGVYMDHMPLPLPENVQLTETGIRQIEGLMRLNCQDLGLAMATADTNAQNTPAVSIDMGQLQEITAAGDVFLEYVQKAGSSHIFTCENLNFNRQQNQLQLTGSETLPVRFNQMQFLDFSYDLTAGQYHGTPFLQSEFSTR